MWELRWVLLGLGAALIVGIYLWGRGTFRRTSPGQRIEPSLPASDEPAAIDETVGEESIEPEQLEAGDGTATASRSDGEVASEPDPLPERVITIRFIPREKQLSSEQVVLALRSAGLQHGRYGIFHHLGPRGPSETLYSVASLTEPGSFDLANLSQSTIPGMSFFMIMPGAGDPLERFDAMVGTARSLARELDAELFDERGSSWSIQRERYVREEIIAYRHQLERA